MVTKAKFKYILLKYSICFIFFLYCCNIFLCNCPHIIDYIFSELELCFLALRIDLTLQNTVEWTNFKIFILLVGQFGYPSAKHKEKVTFKK